MKASSERRVSFTNWEFIDGTGSALISNCTLERDGRSAVVPCCIAVRDITNNNPRGVRNLMDTIIENAIESAEHVWKQSA